MNAGMYSKTGFAAARADGAFSCAANIVMILGAIIVASIFVVRVITISIPVVISLISILVVKIGYDRPKERHLLCA